MALTAEQADRIAEAIDPIVAAYLDAKTEAERTGLPATRPLPGGSLTFDPAVAAQLLAS
jgi:hypothetical protein